jgi:hypothetical protein
VSWSQSSFLNRRKTLPLSRIEPRFLGCLISSLAANRLWYFVSTVKMPGPIDGHFSKRYFEKKKKKILTACKFVYLFSLNSNMKLSLQIMASGFVEFFLYLSYSVWIPLLGCRLQEEGVYVRFP